MNGIFRVIKAFSQEFTVDCFGKQIICAAKKRDKENAILTGDMVEVEDGVVVRVQERRNRLIRPPIANIDQAVIVISPLPKPDFFMLDKMLINCLKNSIEAVICVNKTDICETDFLDEIRAQYSCNKIIVTNALNDEIEELKALLKDKVTCLTGQSAVGKSTLVNSVLGSFERATGILTSFNRGKNTTTDTELFYVNGGWIADTPGFSLIDIFDIEAAELDLFYPEFDSHLNSCKFHRCSHTGEPDCAIEENVKLGTINEQRYIRFKEIFTQLKEKKAWKK